VREDGQRLELKLDDALSAKLHARVYVPDTPLVPGTTYYADETGYCAPECSYCTSPCFEWHLTIGDADEQPPSAPAVVARTLLVPDPSGSSSGFSCPDFDQLELTIISSDDRTARKELTFGAYVAPTAEEVAAATDFFLLFGYDYSENPTTSTFTLGDSLGRHREQSYFGASSFCFALAAFDRSGNVSERSVTTCLDTADENDPSVVWVDSNGGCGCGSTKADGNGWLVVVAVAYGLRKRTRGRSAEASVKLLGGTRALARAR
jgi:MYXO-CTERM domain-containing protein